MGNTTKIPYPMALPMRDPPTLARAWTLMQGLAKFKNGFPTFEHSAQWDTELNLAALRRIHHVRLRVRRTAPRIRRARPARGRRAAMHPAGASNQRTEREKSCRRCPLRNLAHRRRPV